ncbi:MAG TPA: ComF family protein [Spirochaetota bacterium]|nr:ComF family protein [Spirochaetota bacterium]HPR48761.1 ComF family protein [Spirochaetota bacterium]
MTGTIALSEYGGMMKTLISAMKFQKKPRIAGYLAELAVSQIRNTAGSIDLITSVPMNKKKQWARGFNQSELVARKIGKILKLPYKKVLAEMPHSGLQKTLSLNERFINIIGRYKVIDESVAGQSVLLVDDVFTTGATINECSRLLIDAGCHCVNALVLARVNLNSGGISC